MAYTPRKAEGPRANPEWAKLPRRHCDDCGKLYKPFRPLRAGIDQYGFCCSNCKTSFHKHGGAYRKLRDVTRQMVAKELEKVRKDLSAMISGEWALLMAPMRVLDADGRECSVKWPHEQNAKMTVPARTK